MNNKVQCLIFAVLVLSTPVVQAVPVTYSFQGAGFTTFDPGLPAGLSSVSGTFTTDLAPSLTDPLALYTLTTWSFTDGLTTVTNSTPGYTADMYGYTDTNGFLTDFNININGFAQATAIGDHANFQAGYEDGVGLILYGDISGSLYCLDVTGTGCASAGMALSQGGSLSIITSVPAPATLALLGIGLAGIGFSKRKA